MVIDPLQGITVFVRVAEARSFTGAARKLGISTSGRARRSRGSRTSWGVRLIQRTTRSVGLTDDGNAFY